MKYAQEKRKVISILIVRAIMKKKKYNMKLIWMRNILVLHRSSGLIFPSIGLGVSSRDLRPGLFLFLVQPPAFFCTGSIVSPTKEIFCLD